jgi:class 4 POU domain transcription factor
MNSSLGIHHGHHLNHSNHTSNNSANGGSSADRKRKRTSIAAPEKRSLEAFFSVQPRPSGEKISQIAEKLDLKKNVVRVWFCNQRQKQKRMKFAAIQGR